MILTLGLAYYRNPAMLAHQFRVWAAYPADLKAQIAVMVVDDGSPEAAIDVPRPAGLPTLTLGRLADVHDPFTPPWRQDAARNRIAHEAQTPWLFLTDMDHVLPADSLRALLATIATGRDATYTFLRLDAPDFVPKRDAAGHMHPHPNTYALTKARYWQAGGYDEDACGIYGTDGDFRRRLLEIAPIVHLADVPIVRYPRDVIPDASTRVDRKAFKGTPEQQQRLAAKRSRGAPPAVLAIPYRQQYAEAA